MSQNSSEMTGLLHGAIQRLAAQSANCKAWSAVLCSVVLLFVVGRTDGKSFLLAAVPVALLAFVDTGYVAQGRRIAGFAAKRDGGKTINTDDLLHLQTSAGVNELAGFLTALLSLSVWPFYAALAGTVLLLGQMSSSPVKQNPVPASFVTPQTLTSPSPISRPAYPSPLPAPPAASPKGFGGPSTPTTLRTTNPFTPNRPNSLPTGTSSVSPNSQPPNVRSTPKAGIPAPTTSGQPSSATPPVPSASPSSAK